MTETSKIDWTDGRLRREPTWPLLGYAPGTYMVKCLTCDQRLYNMDKRAWNCLSCAIDAANAMMTQQRTALEDLRKENETLRAAIKIVGEAS